jgi:hypothetical protein
MWRKSALFLLALSGGCHSDRLAPRDQTVTVDSGSAWAGNTIIARSAAFIGADSVPIVTVGAETLQVHGAGLNAVTITMPDTGGVITPVIHFQGSVGVPGPSIILHGYAGWSTGPVVDANPYPWPGTGAAPTVLVFANGSLVSLNAATGASQVLAPAPPGQSNCIVGPVPAIEPGLVIVAYPTPNSPNSCTAVAVPTFPGAPAADSGPTDLFGWPIIQLGRGRWLESRKQAFSLKVRQAPDSFITAASGMPCNNPAGFVVSPARNRIVPIGYCTSGAAGEPVFDTTSTSPLYTVPGIQADVGAGFSAAGDTLFIAGTTGPDTNLFALNAANGAVLGQAAIPPYDFGLSIAVAAEPALPWVFVATGHYSGGPSGSDIPVVQVFDRRTMASVATLRLPAGSAVGTGGIVGYVFLVFALDAASRRLYLTINSFLTPSQLYVVRYDLP